jgi:hypothetical protein
LARQQGTRRGDTDCSESADPGFDDPPFFSAEADFDRTAEGHLGFELAIGFSHFAHEAFEFDAAVEMVYIADEGDGVLRAAGCWETETVIAEEALDVGDELPLELLMLGWIRKVSHG